MPRNKGWQHQNNASRQSRGYGAAWDKLRKYVLERDMHLCQCEQCKAEDRVTNASEVDHILPKSKGGTDALSNLQAINYECHKRKTILENGRTPKPTVGADGWTTGG